jgi:hypothetical protein
MDGPPRWINIWRSPRDSLPRSGTFRRAIGLATTRWRQLAMTREFYATPPVV